MRCYIIVKDPEEIHSFGTDCIAFPITSPWSDYFWDKKEQRRVVVNREPFDKDQVYSLSWSWLEKRVEYHLNRSKEEQVKSLVTILEASGDKGIPHCESICSR